MTTPTDVSTILTKAQEVIDSAVQTVTAAKATQNTLEQNIYTTDIKIALHNTGITSHPDIRAQLSSLSGNSGASGPSSGARTFIINLDDESAVTDIIVQGGSENTSTIFINGPASDANGLALTYNITTADPELIFSKTAGIQPNEKVSITVAKVSVPTLKSFEITTTNTAGETSAEGVEIAFTVNPIEVTGQPSITYPINGAKTEYYNGFTFTWSAAEKLLTWIIGLHILPTVQNLKSIINSKTEHQGYSVRSIPDACKLLSFLFWESVICTCK